MQTAFSTPAMQFDLPPLRGAIRLRDTSADQRRAGDRTRTLYRLARLRTSTDSGLCRVQNVSDGGMMLFTSLEAPEGSIVMIMLSETVSLSAEVVWANAVRLGVRFLEPIDSAALLRALAAERLSGRQRSPRLPVDTVAVAATEQGTQILRVVDVSQHGMKVSHDGSFRIGQAARLQLENGIERRGVVRWSENGMAGIRLLEPIAYQQLESASSL